MVLLVDPLSEEAFTIYPVVEMFVRGQAPLRISFLFQPSEQNPNLGQSRNPESSDEPLADVFISCYYYLYHSNSPASALTFLSKVSFILIFFFLILW